MLSILYILQTRKKESNQMFNFYFKVRDKPFIAILDIKQIAKRRSTLQVNWRTFFQQMEKKITELYIKNKSKTSLLILLSATPKIINIFLDCPLFSTASLSIYSLILIHSLQLQNENNSINAISPQLLLTIDSLPS